MRATMMVVEARYDVATKSGVFRRVGEQLGTNLEALRARVKQAEIDGCLRPGTGSEEAARLSELEREVLELRRTIRILRQASACLSLRGSTASRGDVRVHRRSPR